MKLMRMVEDPRPTESLLEEDLRAQGIEPSELPRSVVEKIVQCADRLVKKDELNDDESAFDEWAARMELETELNVAQHGRLMTEQQADYMRKEYLGMVLEP